MRALSLFLAFLVCDARAAATKDVGVIVMAHGGDEAWNAVVEKAVAPLRAKRPTEIAWGMADADALQEAVFALEKRGVRRIAVVRLFLNGDSFLLRTKKILGIMPGAPIGHADVDAREPDKLITVTGSGDGEPRVVTKPMPGMSGMHMPHDMRFMDPDKMPLWRVVTVSTFVVSTDGLMESGLSPAIMAKRALALSKAPAKESVLLLAHGVGDDAADARWRAAMDPAVAAVRKAAAFRKVAAVTFRDDWPEAHAKAVAEIRDFVSQAHAEGGRALVVPYRLYGFGPQSDDLKGLDFATDDKGLLPDPLVDRWLLDEADRSVKRAGWE